MLRRFQKIATKYFTPYIMKTQIFFKYKNHWNTFGGSQLFHNKVNQNKIKRVSKFNSQQLKQMYSNSIIIIDEAHHLRNENNNNIYSTFHDLLHSVENCKIFC